MGILIRLTPEEYNFAVSIAEKRQSEAEKRKLPDKHGFRKKGSEAGRQIHIVGAAGELAAAKALDLKWEASVNTFKKISDLRDDLEVRTRTKDTYDLIVRKDDKDERKFLLVYQKSLYDYEVVGWISGKDAKNSEWEQRYGGRPPAYFVPKDYLRDVKELKK